MSTDNKNRSRSGASHLEDFDLHSGSPLERLIFNRRALVLILCLIASLVLAWQASSLRLNASFEKMIPTGHPYIANFLDNRAELSGLGNSMRIAVAVKEGSIFDDNYLRTLAKINDEVYLLPGVDRPYMKSLWTPATRWIAVTEEGLEGDTVIPGDYDGSEQSLEQVRLNVQRSGEIGQLVSPNFQSSVIYVPLLDTNPQTGEPLDYGELSRQIEQIRSKYQAGSIEIHITGFAKIVGDLIEGLQQVLGFFAVAVAVATAVLYGYTHCLRSALLVMGCSLVGVLWQLGLLALLGFELDPYSILVPFLVFAIGISHGAQKMNGIMRDIGSGLHRYVAARHTFRRLFRTGMAALITDAVGFAVLLVIDIGVIRELAIAASLGVMVLILTNLVLLPVLLSFIGVTPRAAARAVRSEPVGDEEVEQGRIWRFFALFTQRRWALGALGVAALMALSAGLVSRDLQIGDLDAGAPELRADSRYNRDNAFMVDNYAASSDIFVVMVQTPVDGCTRYSVLSKVRALTSELERLPGVESTNSMARLSRFAMVGYNEGNFKWLELIPNDAALGAVQTRAPRELFNQECSLLSVYAYLKDHKAATLESVVATVEAFAAEHNDDETHFMLAAGNSGIEAATNIVVEQSMDRMMYLVYGAVILLCWITFRSWRGVVAAVLPLMLTSVIGQALMVELGIGIKVAILPVIALGVGIGVDYALYVLSVLLIGLRDGQSLGDAYRSALRQTGRIVMLTGATLAVAVATWVFSPIRFQADMGILLAFMFLFNMLGALILLPALAHLLFRAETTERSGQRGQPGEEEGNSPGAEVAQNSTAYALTGDERHA
ncbi:transport protein [Marinobacterium lacunae]|uniref:Transport protein n=1 Tax=Marinobacterium lacunae TaxID=1232683 RepID=A0A081G2R6_9GAMM|nr:MMPL family transporter [Marinobacterium lacunae]KEA65071.1 transport protein [Marinobacterium lacunae]